MFLMMPSTKNAQMILLHRKREKQSFRLEMSSNEISWTTGPKSK